MYDLNYYDCINALNKWVQHIEIANALNNTKLLEFFFNQWKRFTIIISKRPALLTCTDFDIWIANKIFYKIQKSQCLSQSSQYP